MEQANTKIRMKSLQIMQNHEMLGHVLTQNWPAKNSSPTRNFLGMKNICVLMKYIVKKQELKYLKIPAPGEKNSALAHLQELDLVTFSSFPSLFPFPFFFRLLRVLSLFPVHVFAARVSILD